MKTKTVRNLSAALVCIFILAVFTLLGGLFYYYREGLKNAERIFAALPGVETEFTFNGETLSQELTKKLEEQLSFNENLAAISIRLNDKVVYTKPVPSNFFSDPVAGTLAAPFPLYKIMTSDFAPQTGGQGDISAVISVLNPGEIFKSARIAFLMILAATIATIILIMYAKIYPEQNKEVPQQKNEPELDVQLLESAPPDARTLQDLPLEIPEELPDFEISPRETGGLFYSLETGFMKETFINQVLDPILISADSYNEDIALLIVSVPGLDRISSEGEDLSRCFLDQFQSKECIFEYQNDGFAVIMRNTDIEKAVQEAEALYITLNEILNPEGTNGQREPVEIGMGISTKTFRTALGASHLFSEARQAVARALENDETPIVALKINPEKYQEFLKKNYSQDEVPVS